MGDANFSPADNNIGNCWVDAEALPRPSIGQSLSEFRVDKRSLIGWEARQNPDTSADIKNRQSISFRGRFLDQKQSACIGVNTTCALKEEQAYAVNKKHA